MFFLFFPSELGLNTHFVQQGGNTDMILIESYYFLTES